MKNSVNIVKVLGDVVKIIGTSEKEDGSLVWEAYFNKDNLIAQNSENKEEKIRKDSEVEFLYLFNISTNRGEVFFLDSPDQFEERKELQEFIIGYGFQNRLSYGLFQDENVFVDRAFKDRLSAYDGVEVQIDLSKIQNENVKGVFAENGRKQEGDVLNFTPVDLLSMASSVFSMVASLASLKYIIHSSSQERKSHNSITVNIKGDNKTSLEILPLLVDKLKDSEKDIVINIET